MTSVRSTSDKTPLLGGIPRTPAATAPSVQAMDASPVKHATPTTSAANTHHRRTLSDDSVGSNEKEDNCCCECLAIICCSCLCND